MRNDRPVSCVLDTDILIDVLRQRRYATALVDQWTIGRLAAVSAIAHLEVYQGMRIGEEEATEALLSGLVSIPVDAHLAREAGLLLRDARSRGLTIGVADGIVAATALSLGVPVLTRNVSHYPFPGLNVVKGTD